MHTSTQFEEPKANLVPDVMKLTILDNLAGGTGSMQI